MWSPASFSLIFKHFFLFEEKGKREDKTERQEMAYKDSKCGGDKRWTHMLKMKLWA